ncbi:MAG: CRISPR-associated ring nuclease Csm6, partial [Candidatus Latescibacterota bacterium]
MKHVLIAVGGETPQIITEAVQALHEQHQVAVAEVHVLTTARGRDLLVRDLLDPPHARLSALCREYQLPTRFSAEMIWVYRDGDGQELDDVRTAEDNVCVRDQTFDNVRQLTSAADVCLHGCIAGGRKSMSYFLGAAFTFFRRVSGDGHPGDHLYHVLVRPAAVERIRAFFYVPRQEQVYEIPAAPGQQAGTISSADIRIELAELPCVSVRSLLTFPSPLFPRSWQSPSLRRQTTVAGGRQGVAMPGLGGRQSVAAERRLAPAWTAVFGS